MIALSTIVTLLIPEDERDKANGQIGVVNGMTFSVVSVFSGIVIGQFGMTVAVSIAVVMMMVVI